MGKGTKVVEPEALTHELFTFLLAPFSLSGGQGSSTRVIKEES